MNAKIGSSFSTLHEVPIESKLCFLQMRSVPTGKIGTLRKLPKGTFLFILSRSKYKVDKIA